MNKITKLNEKVNISTYITFHVYLIPRILQRKLNGILLFGNFVLALDFATNWGLPVDDLMNKIK